MVSIEYRNTYNSIFDLLRTNLIFYRSQRELTQSKLAAKIGFQRSYLAALESGKRNPSIIKIYEIAEGLQIEPWRFMKPITYDEWYYGKEVGFTPYDFDTNKPKLCPVSEHYFHLIHHIKFNRKQFGWSRLTLAESCGLSEIFIRQIETGKKEPSLESIDKIATAFQYPLWEFLQSSNTEFIWLEHTMWI